MAATSIPVKTTGGIDTVVTLTNGVKYVSIVIPALYDEKGRETHPERRLHLTEEQADRLSDVLTNKSVNVSRGTHDNSEEAL